MVKGQGEAPLPGTGSPLALSGASSEKAKTDLARFPDSPEAAVRWIARGFQVLLDARSYRAVCVEKNGGDNYTVIDLVRRRGADLGHELMRSEFVLLDSAAGEPAFTQIDIAVDGLNWVMRDGGARDQRAILLEDRMPATTWGYHKNLGREAAAQGPGPADAFSFHRTDGNIVIEQRNGATGTQRVYSFDPATGALLSLVETRNGQTSLQRFELNPTVDDSLFVIPENKVLVRSSDPQRWLTSLVKPTK